MLLLVVRVVMPCRYQRSFATSVFMYEIARRHSPEYRETQTSLLQNVYLLFIRTD